MNHLSSPRPIRGRFAPTPSGPLHLGSLLTALAGWLSARSVGGSWLLRIDDLDAPRCPPGAADTILGQLEAHGLHWDETPRIQSQHLIQYTETLHQLQSCGLLYGCSCSRATLAAESLAGPDGPVYSGRCREQPPTGETAAALRFRIADDTIQLRDGVQGLLSRHAVDDIGDFVVRRADGIIGYQLACVVDESEQAVTQVIRGADLLGSSLRQIALLKSLQKPIPSYAHLPLLVEPNGRKLSKQNGAAALDNRRAADNLVQCLSLLGQCPPTKLCGATITEILAWGSAHWRVASVPKCATLSASLAS